METLPEDKQVIELISKLKNSNGTYPKDMLYSRREQFMRQVANAGLGMGIGAGIKHAAEHSQTAATVTTTITGKIIETVLIAAIVIEAGATSYVYRHKIADFFKSFRETPSPTASETIHQAVGNPSTSLPDILPTLTPPPTSSIPSTATLIFTPVPPIQLNNNNSSNTNNGNSGINNTVTPVPTDANGNHYGQTPRPEQTKSGNGN